MNRIITKSCIGFNEEENFLNETLFHNANGYIGVRGALEEGVPNGVGTMRGTYINGFYDIIPMKQAEMLCNFVDKKETMLNVADTMSVSCVVDGELFDPNSGKVLEHTRVLNMDKGITQRHIVWETPSKKQVEIDITRMTSFEVLSLFSIEYTVRPINFEGDIKIISTHNPYVSNFSNPGDPRLAAESLKNLEVSDFYVDNNSTVAVSVTSVSKLRMCSLVNNSLSTSDGSKVKNEKTEIIGEQGVYTGTAHIEKGGSVSLQKLSVFSDSIRTKNVIGKVAHDLEAVLDLGLSSLYIAQEKYMSQFWSKCEMEIDGDPDMNVAVAFNMYELLQSSAKDCHASIAAKGMSGEGYEGHYFWDTETFILPFFTLTTPELSKMLLRYRYSTLNKARENARLLGHKSGALFPWRTITGTECSGYFVSGSAAYHINADIAYAFINYYLVTGDLDFMREAGFEVLMETSRLWMDLGCYNRDGKFVLNDVTGPDEYTCMVNNNYYTNMAAKYNMNWAVKIHGILEEAGKIGDLDRRLSVTDAELKRIEDAADKMLLLYDEELGINPQDDSFLSKPIWNLEETPKDKFPLLLHYHPLHLYRYQVCKQADTVLAYVMFENEQPKDVMTRSYEYYEKITTHDSSLSTCAFSIAASKLGLRDKAYLYFGDSAKLDLMNTHNNSKYGIHTANMGGCFMAIVYGFAGLRIDENGMRLNPNVPKCWNGFRFKVVYHGRLIRVTADKFEVSVELLEGKKLTINLYDNEVELKPGVRVSIPTEE